MFQLPRHGAAVYAQIVGQGGHTVRQLKIICADNCGELVKIIDQFFADRSLAENIHSRAQRARLFGHELQQIRNQRGMAAAGVFALPLNVFVGDKGDFGGLETLCGNGVIFFGRIGIQPPKHFIFFDDFQNAFSSVEINP